MHIHNRYYPMNGSTPHDWSWAEKIIEENNEKRNKMPKVKILCGIPCSGKSTYSRTFKGWKVISRDQIRLDYFGKGYKHSPQAENEVTDLFNSELDTAIYHKTNIIVDNTHAREKYLNELLKRFENTEYEIKIKFFDVPLWKAYYRNFVRRFREGKHKWIPMKVLKRFKQNYDKIDKIKYKDYGDKFEVGSVDRRFGRNGC